MKGPRLHPPPSVQLGHFYGPSALIGADYRVEKMRYGKKGQDKDLVTPHYNDRITLTGSRWKPTTMCQAVGADRNLSHF